MKLFQAYHLLPVIFLSLTAASTAVPKYAKEGCNDMCGNVRIPFPFGIGAKCSINEWYTVDCNSNIPYLSALSHLQVVGVDLENQTVTVKMPTISDCGRSMSIDLDRSPFLYSKSHNKFVFEGCGNAFILDQHGNVLTGCSTDCGNNTVSEKNKCLGINCCETTIPHYLKSYKMNITRMERQGGDEACGTAFLVDKNSYSYIDEGKFSDSNSFILTSLLWTLSDLYPQIPCCRPYSNKRPLKVDLGNGAFMDTWKCQRLFSSDYHGNIYLEDGCNIVTAKQIATLKYAKLGCKDTCGSVRIPYPFGIGAKCSINKWYNVDCNSSTPYLPALNHLQVVGVDLENQTVIVNTPTISNFSNGGPIVRTSIVLDRSPFFFSKSQNIFVYEGCGNAVMMDQYGSALTGCSTDCHDNSVSDKNNCLGITCCQTEIPHHLKSYSMNITQLERQGRDGGCGLAFLVDKNSHDRRNSVFKHSNSSIPISLMWILSDFDQVRCCKLGRYIGEYRADNIDGYRVKVDLGNGTAVDTLHCVVSEDFYGNPSLIDGNPYLIDGCDHGSGTEECRSCRRSGGECAYDTMTDVDGLVYWQNFSCYTEKLYPDLYESRSSSTSLGVILGVSISMSVLFLVMFSYLLYKVIKKTKDRRQRKRFFKRNGGLLLKQQQEADQSLVDKTILFTSRELEKATDNFNENRILGRGGQGTVYKGMLVDGRIVAVKKSKIVDENQLEQFINEVVILSQINHRNVVKLLGCCLETEVPLLVSEFISNGTLYDRLHNVIDEFTISLNMRLQIATEIAAALAYLHSATTIPIYHRDIKTTNILLDDKYRAKVSDFGTSRFVSVDQTHLTTLVKGTFGYLDPEYFQSSQFTEKSDVYSFGVVLVELLTGERPISLTRFGENRSLATHFMLAMEEGRVMSIFDALVIKEGTRDELQLLANLAMRCLNLNGKNRPTMKEVAMELEAIRMSHIPSTVQINIRPVMYGEELSMHTYGESSTFSSLNDNVIQ